MDANIANPNPLDANPRNTSDKTFANAVALDRDLCWFCQKRAANGKFEPAVLRLSNVELATVEVPRCAMCLLRHTVFFYLPAVVGVLLIIWGTVVSDARDGSVVAQWLILWMILAIAGVLWIFFGNPWWLRRSIASFPPVKAKLDTGWQFLSSFVLELECIGCGKPLRDDHQPWRFSGLMQAILWVRTFLAVMNNNGPRCNRCQQQHDRQ